AVVERAGSLDVRLAVARRPVRAIGALAALEEPFLRNGRVQELAHDPNASSEVLAARFALLSPSDRRAVMPLAFSLPAASAAWHDASGCTLDQLDAALERCRAEGLLGADTDVFPGEVSAAMRRAATHSERAAVATAAAKADPGSRAAVASH